MGFGDKRISAKEGEETSPLQRTRKVRWHKPSLDDKYGKNIAFVGQPMVGKTLGALLLAYFNSKYKKMIRDAGYERVIEVMDAGLLPEIEKIIIIETENNILKALTTGVEKALIKRFVKAKIIDVATIIFPRKEVKIADGNKIVTMRRELIEELKQEFDDTVAEVVAENDENTLFIIDTMTGYKKALDDKFGILYEILNKRDNAVFEGVDTYRQSYYASRNTWWENLMQSKRGYKGWNVDIYKESEVPEHWLKPGEDPFRIKWVGGTEHNLDMVYRVTKHSDESRSFEILNGRYCPSVIEEWDFAYPLHSEMGAMPLIDSMAEKLLLGEEGE